MNGICDEWLDVDGGEEARSDDAEGSAALDDDVDADVDAPSCGAVSRLRLMIARSCDVTRQAYIVVPPLLAVAADVEVAAAEAASAPAPEVEVTLGASNGGAEFGGVPYGVMTSSLSLDMFTFVL